MNRRQKLIVVAFGCAAGLAASPAPAQDNPNGWKFTATIYGWFPDIGGQTNLPVGNTSIDVDIGTILDHLKMTAQGAFDFRKGHWGGFTDIVYLNVGEAKNNARNVEIGGVTLPATVTSSLDFNLKSTFATFGATYQLADGSRASAALLFGARLASMNQSLDWTFTGNFGAVTPPPLTGSRETSVDQWDAIVGLRGQLKFGEGGKWAMPFHFDIGAGDSDLTLQAMLGLTHGFGWGDIGVAWRYLDYDLKSGEAIDHINFSGPAVGMNIHW